MANFDVLLFGGVVAIGIVAGFAFAAVGLPYALGFAIAGVVLVAGGWVPVALAGQMAEVGLVLVLFYLGSELSAARFRRSGALSSVLVTVQVIAAFALGFVISLFFGFTPLESVAAGAMLAMSSTLVTTRFMQDRLLHGNEGQVVAGVLIAQDFLAVAALAFLSGISTLGAAGALVAALAFVVIAFFVVSRASFAAWQILEPLGHGRKILLLAAVLGVVVAGGAVLVGLTPLLGAYFAGVAIAETRYGEKIRRDAGFAREGFALLFFLGVGGLAAPHLAAALSGVGLAYTVLMIAGFLAVNALVYWLIATILGMPSQSAATTGILLSGLGEFSHAIPLALLAGAVASGAATTAGANALLATALVAFVVTVSLMPLLYRNASKIAHLFTRLYPRRGRAFVRGVNRRTVYDPSVVSKALLQHQGTTAVKTMLLHAVVLVCVAFLANMGLDRVGPAAPTAAVAAIAIASLLLAAWPSLTVFLTLRSLAESVARHLLRNSFSHLPAGHKHPPESLAAQAVTSAALAFIGLAATAFLYTLSPAYALPAAAYTIIAAGLCGMAFDKLLNHYADAGSRLPGLDLSEPSQDKSPMRLMVEREHIRDKLSAALTAGDANRAKSLVSSLGHKEARLLRQLHPRPSAPVVQSRHHRLKHFARYLIGRSK